MRLLLRLKFDTIGLPLHSPAVPLLNLLVATEDGPELGVSADTQEVSEGTPGAHAHSPHTSATVTRNGERMLRSLTNGSTTSGDVGRSAAAARETESATPHGNVTATGDSHLVSGSLASSRTLGGEEQRSRTSFRIPSAHLPICAQS